MPSTPKKLAKIWSRQHISLQELQIDADDIEELENALRQLLMSASASTADLNNRSFQQSPFGSAYMPGLSGTAAGIGVGGGGGGGMLSILPVLLVLVLVLVLVCIRQQNPGQSTTHLEIMHQ